MYRRGWRWVRPEAEQVANAPDSFVDLTPASPAPAALVFFNWAPLMLQPGETWQRS